MTKQYKFDKEAIFASLDKLEAKPKSEFTAFEIIKQSRARISNSLKKNFTFAEITKWFNDHECSITVDELQEEYEKAQKEFDLKNKKTRKSRKSLTKESTDSSTESPELNEPNQNSARR